MGYKVDCKICLVIVNMDNKNLFGLHFRVCSFSSYSEELFLTFPTFASGLSRLLCTDKETNRLNENFIESRVRTGEYFLSCFILFKRNQRAGLIGTPKITGSKVMEHRNINFHVSNKAFRVLF